MKDLIIFKDTFLQGTYEFHYKDLVAGVFYPSQKEREIIIYKIESKIKNKGNCQKFMKLWITDAKKQGWAIASTVPLNDAWRHICDKLNIKIYE